MIFIYPRSGRLTKVSGLTKATKTTNLLAMDEIHLNDGTIIDMRTGEIIDPLPGETKDCRIIAARTHLAETSKRKTHDLTLPELRSEVIVLRRLLRGTIAVADDWAVAYPAEVLDQYEEFIPP
jgi:hypothetical protein